MITTFLPLGSAINTGPYCVATSGSCKLEGGIPASRCVALEHRSNTSKVFYTLLFQANVTWISIKPELEWYVENFRGNGHS
jgi:hypothetical protein